MSGKSCVIRMHAAPVANDMQHSKRQVTSREALVDAVGEQQRGPPNNTINSVPVAMNSSGSNNAFVAVGAGGGVLASAASASTGNSSGGNSHNSSTVPSNAKAPIAASHMMTGGGKNGVSPGFVVNKTVAATPNSTAAAGNSNHNTPNLSKAGLPLPPRGTGIRHNIQISAAVAAPARPRAAPRTAAATPPPNASKIIRKSPPRERAPVAAITTTTTTPNNIKKRDKMDEDGGEGQDDYYSDSMSASGSMSGDDDSISSSSSFDSNDSRSSYTGSSCSSASASGPLHEQMEEAETVSPDLEFAVIATRKKGMLLSRLSEVSMRGHLSVVDLARRGLGINDIALIEQTIISNPRLSVLKLGYNDIGDVGAQCIADALCIEANGRIEHRPIAVLDLTFNGIGDEGIGGLAMKAIAGNYHLRTLFLTGNNIGEKGALSIAGALVHGCYLSRLHLTANKIGPKGTKALATAVAEIESRLQMHESAPDPMRAIGMRGRVQRYQRMEHLFLGSTAMESEGFYSIPSMLVSNASLKVICLTDNNIDDSDMAVLAQALTQNKNLPLEAILLSFNQITDVGVEALMNSIWGSPTLKEIKLDNNKMADRGAQLCAVVLTAVKLEKMDVSFNPITTVGIRALMKSLSEDTNVKSLGLSGIQIDLNAAKAVSFALAYNTAIETVYLDNCQTGYSAQRHITAGIVSNQAAPLRQLTGFPMGPIAPTLGMPALPEEWSNEKVLSFVRLMWRNWGKKRGPADGPEEPVKGPAPPAAVAAAAKIALASLGSNPGAELYVEPRKNESYNDTDPNNTISPLMPANAALIERTNSGRWQIPAAGDTGGENQNGFLEAWAESTAFGRAATVSYQVTDSQQPRVEAPLDNPEQRNRNLRWLRTHFRPLIDVGNLPFNNADMWQLHQYYFSPPYFADDSDSDSKNAGADEEDKMLGGSNSQSGSKTSSKVAPPSSPSLSDKTGPGRAISFQALNSAVEAAGLAAASHKRRGHGHDTDTDEDASKKLREAEPSAKRTKSMKPRIAYYPRIRAKLESLGTKPLEQTLSLLRKLKYVENVIFPEHASYEELDKLRESQHATRLDVEMILLDLI